MGEFVPYYEQDGITIYHGDCREILPGLPKVDLVLTDPPYGIGEAAGKNKSRGFLAQSKDYGNSDWDNAIQPDAILQAVALAKQAIVFGGNYYPLPPASCWLVWDKENGETDFADCELAWTNLKKAVRIKRHQWHGMIRKGNEERVHPTQKPLDVIRWAMSFTDGQIVLDPFMGSGTTLLAAKLEGRRAIGIEIEEKYCEIAANRLRQKVLF
jgi:DNA modification methylase